VKNGPNFCIFVEKQTGLSFQMGADNLQAVTDDNAVSLTELKDACFYDKKSFACGDGFVIGESKPIDVLITDSKISAPISKYTSAFTSAAKSCLSEIKSQGLQEEGSSPLKSSILNDSKI